MPLSKPSSTPPSSPLDLAPPDTRDELNRTFTQYRYLSGMGSEASFAVSCRFFIDDHRCTADDVNTALRACRAPERMKDFRFVADLMAFFAERVVANRNARVERERAREIESRDVRYTPATPEQISRLRNQFNGIGAMP